MDFFWLSRKTVWRILYEIYTPEKGETEVKKSDESHKELFENEMKLCDVEGGNESGKELLVYHNFGHFYL